MPEANEWVKTCRRTHEGQRGGVRVYIDSETLQQSLASTEIPLDAELLVRRYPLKSGKKVARILLKIREDKNVRKKV